jgi:hypothetical protein
MKTVPQTQRSTRPGFSRAQNQAALSPITLSIRPRTGPLARAAAACPWPNARPSDYSLPFPPVARLPCRAVDQDPPLLRDVHPDLVAELAALLAAEGEHDLAITVHDVRMVGDCGCGDDFCRSIRTSDHPPGQPYGPGHRCVPLLPEQGMLILDVVDGRIVYIEILHRPR